MKQYIGIAKDHSGSMWSLRSGAIKDYNNVISSLKKAAGDTDIETRLSVVEFANRASMVATNKLLEDFSPSNQYYTNGGTALFDAVVN